MAEGEEEDEFDEEAVGWEFAEKAFGVAQDMVAAREPGRELPRASFAELRKCFLPGRTKEDVERVGDKLAASVYEMGGNNSLIHHSNPPNCRAVGLSDDPFDSCYFEGSPSDPLLVCDCSPGGYRTYTPEDYAEHHIYKTIEGKPWLHYSDWPRGTRSGLFKYIDAKKKGDLPGMVLGIDEIVNAVHGSGRMAKIFVESGVETLERLKTD